MKISNVDAIRIDNIEKNEDSIILSGKLQRERGGEGEIFFDISLIDNDSEHGKTNLEKFHKSLEILTNNEDDLPISVESWNKSTNFKSGETIRGFEINILLGMYTPINFYIRGCEMVVSEDKQRIEHTKQLFRKIYQEV